MTSRRDLDVLAEAGRAAVRAAQDDLLLFMASIDVDNRAVAQAALHEFLPALIAQYGDVAATAAAEWYENVRAAQIGGSYFAQLGASASERSVQAAVGYAVAASDPAEIPSRLLASAQRLVMFSQRATVGLNAASDPRRPRFARVPTGAVTCAFCLLTASRGFEYGTRQAAGDSGSGFGSDYHSDCDCQVVADFDGSGVEGYDPDSMYDFYLRARERAGSGDTSSILAAMRELGGVSDAHAH